MIPILWIVLPCAVSEIDGRPEDPDHVLLEGLVIERSEGESDGLGSFTLPFHFPAHPRSIHFLSFGASFSRFVVYPEIRVRLARSQTEGLAGFRARGHIESADEMR